ncbi:MAG TPA: hybrid sensor histidine kinase/response regulator, partial [Gillisia sp.]|nr:hybrid sensor histidine kinase/response regulator [Gillisia sp.]
MKNIILTFLLLFCCYTSVAQQRSNEEISGINSNIQNLLNEAEISINVLNFEKALIQLKNALELSKQINDQKYIALSSSILSKLYYIRHDQDQAITELQRAISIQREINDEAGLAYSYLNFAKIFNVKRDYERANKYLNLAEKYYTKENNTEYLGLVNLNRGIITLNSDNSSKNRNLAISQLNKAEIYLGESNNLYETSRLHYYKGRAYLTLKRLEEAEAESLKSLKIANTNDFGGMIMYSYNLLSQIYEKQKNYIKSLAYLRTSDHVRDSIYALNREALALDDNTRYEVNALKSNIEELKIQNAEQVRSLKVNKLTTILSVALITILSL